MASSRGYRGVGFLFLIMLAHVLTASQAVHASRVGQAVSGMHVRLGSMAAEKTGFKHIVVGEGSGVPDLSLVENQEAFDDYIDNLLANSLSDEQAAEWEWLDRSAAAVRVNALKAVNKVGDITGPIVDDLAAGLQDSMHVARDAASRVFDDVRDLGDRGMDALVTAGRSFRRVLTEQPKFTVSEFVRHVILGLANGFTLGSTEFLRPVLFPPKTPSPINPDLEPLLNSLGQLVRVFKNFFTGVFGGRARRMGKTRVNFVKDEIKEVFRVFGKVLAEVWKFMKTGTFFEMARPVFRMIIVMTVFSIVLLAFPGVGWFLKLAAMITTFILVGYRFLSNVLPRLIRSVETCFNGRGVCTKEAAEVMVETTFEMVGMSITVLIAGFPDKATQFPGFDRAFNGNELARATGNAFKPSWVDSSNLFMRTLSGAMSGNKSTGLVDLMKRRDFLDMYKDL
eukprot:comp21605_c1_seq1/m.47580 comp21605_c1_seq1/g.47580  ORF comp21605_c1_seq1/g.47580 comp21605_c1_seq1/m.47580 type:complete len:452 (+) comp21605_c1_seq1:607-1962(+)